MALALKYREKMTEKMSGMKLEGSNGGVTVAYSGEQQPISVVVSESAMAGGAAKVSESAVAAMKTAQLEAQKAMQATIADMQKEIMAELQASAPGGKM